MQFRIEPSPRLKEAILMSQSEVIQIDARLCPLCQQNNACANVEADALSCDNDKASCWCQNSEVKFPAQLLQSIPEPLMDKACICAACYKAAVQLEQTQQERRND